MKALSWKWLLAVALALGTAACHSEEPAPAPAPTTAPVLPTGHPAIGGANTMQGLPAGHPALGSNGITATPPPAHEALRWNDPTGWTKSTPTSSMRYAQYEIPKAGTDPEGAELVVYYFGVGQGGDAMANVTRWQGQFTGGPSDAAKTEKKTVGTLPVTIVTAVGTYDGGMTMSGAAAGPKTGWALLGAIAETPAGPWFFKMTGPAATVKAASPAFEALVSSLHSEG